MRHIEKPGKTPRKATVFGPKALLIPAALAICISACSRPETKTDHVIRAPLPTSAIHLHKLRKLSVTGDFNGDGIRDTLLQHAYSGLKKQEIDSSADPFQNSWDEVEDWFHRQETDIYLSLEKPGNDTLHFGAAQGLYCLINIGDNNHDGKDEIALVVDRLDYSRVNSCEIYSLCDDAWKHLACFNIHEGAFDFMPERKPVFLTIPGFLQTQAGRWLYSDDSRNGYKTMEEIGKMKRLDVPPCTAAAADTQP